MSNIIKFTYSGEVMPPLSPAESRISCFWAKGAGIEWLLDNFEDQTTHDYRLAQIETADGHCVSGIKSMEQFGHYLAHLTEKVQARVNYMRQQALEGRA